MYLFIFWINMNIQTFWISWTCVIPVPQIGIFFFFFFFFGGHTYVELKCCKSFHHCIPKAEVWSPEFWQVFLIKHWMTFMNSDFLPLDLKPVWMEGEEGRVDESREKLIESRLILSQIYSTFTPPSSLSPYLSIQTNHTSSIHVSIIFFIFQFMIRLSLKK